MKESIIKINPFRTVSKQPTLDPILGIEVNPGSMLTRGIFQFVDESLAKDLKESLVLAFSESYESVEVFGFDWMGRVYTTVGQAEGVVVGVFDVASDDTIVLSIDEFSAGISDPKNFDFLLYSILMDWCISINISGLEFGQVGGMKVPIFTGGDDSIENIELSDVSVYWAVVGGLLRTSRNAPAGKILPAVKIANP